MSRSFPRGIVVWFVIGALFASVASFAVGVLAQRPATEAGTGLTVPDEEPKLTTAFRRVSNGGRISLLRSIRENVVVKNKHDVTVTVEGKKNISITGKDPEKPVILFEN